MLRRYAELAVEESPNRSYMFLRALRVWTMSDMGYRQTVITKSPEYKQTPNIVSPPVELFVGPDQSSGIAVVGSDEVKKIADEHSESYEGFIAGIPFNNVAASITEIKRYKDMGARGIQVYAHVNGEAINQEKFWPIYEICETLDLPVLIHLVGGQKVPEFPAEDASKYELWLPVGWPYQTTVTISRLAFAGIFEDFPNLKIVIHHTDAMIPMLEGRIEDGLKMYGGRTAPELKEKLTRARMKGNPLDTFKKLCVDTTSSGSAAAIRCGAEFFRKNHVLFASDMPSDPEQGPSYIDHILKAIGSLDPSAEDQPTILFSDAK